MKNPCHICNSETNFLLKKDGYVLFKCTSCSLVYMNPLPEQNFLNKEVYSKKSGYQSNKVQDLSKSIPDKKTSDILEFLNKRGIKGNLLDVGCSNGEFIYHAEQKGLKGYGVELNERTANIAISNGLNVFGGLLNDAHYDDNFFDVIFLGDIIEHVLSPREFINECKRILKPGGTIIISTPNLDCAWSKSSLVLYKTFGIPWSSVTPPYHTFQFSLNNLELLLSDIGFSKVADWFYKPPRLMYELGSLHLLKKFKIENTFKNFIFMIFSFAIYITMYGVIYMTRFFRTKDFSMISVYTKNI